MPMSWCNNQFLNLSEACSLGRCLVQASRFTLCRFSGQRRPPSSRSHPQSVVNGNHGIPRGIHFPHFVHVLGRGSKGFYILRVMSRHGNNGSLGAKSAFQLFHFGGETAKASTFYALCPEMELTEFQGKSIVFHLFHVAGRDSKGFFT